MLEDHKRVIGENEGIFGEVNELVRPLDQDVMTVLCECGDAACRDQLLIAHDEYARVRQDPTLFVLRPGHDFDETERVEAKHLEYWIVANGLDSRLRLRDTPTPPLPEWKRDLAERQPAAGSPPTPDTLRHSSGSWAARFDWPLRRGRQADSRGSWRGAPPPALGSEWTEVSVASGRVNH